MKGKIIAALCIAALSGATVFAAEGAQAEQPRAHVHRTFEDISEKLQQKLADGEITQEEYDEAVQKAEQRKAGFGEKCERGGKPDRKAKLEEKLANGEITQEEYDKIIAERGEKPDRKAKLEEKLANGEITQEEYDKIIAERGKKPDRKAKLEEKLANGEITQEEYDKIIAERESRRADGVKGGKPGTEKGKKVKDTEADAV